MVSICATPMLVFEINVAAIFAACDIDVLARRNKRLALFELRNALARLTIFHNAIRSAWAGSARRATNAKIETNG